MEENSIRYLVLKSARDFKTSWIDLGRALYSVWKEKLYKEWGYSEFDTYTAKEIGIRKQTAMKLLKSYYFLEKEEPAYLATEHAEKQDASTVPSFESIDCLRLAKSKKVLDDGDYSKLKKDVFENGKDSREIKKSLQVMIRERQELEPEEAQEKKKITAVKRLLGTLKSIKREAEVLKLLPAPLIKETADLISKLERQINYSAAQN